MRSVYPVPPRRARPDLEPGHPDQAAPVAAPREREAMVRFDDGTWHLCRAGGWQRHGGGWLVRLAWGESGVIRDGWFRYDPGKVQGFQASR